MFYSKLSGLQIELHDGCQACVPASIGRLDSVLRQLGGRH